MAEFTLIIGNRNYSSWSLRAGLVLRRSGADFTEVVIALDLPETRLALRAHSPAAKESVLRHGTLSKWD